MDEWSRIRERMVSEQLEARGLVHAGVLDAMRRVPRHLFVPVSAMAAAYADQALPIGDGQTISQPFMVARMTEALVGEAVLRRVLEIGTGSGYQAAVLSLLAEQVITIERRPELARSAAGRLRALGFDNVEVVTGDGTVGLAMPDSGGGHRNGFNGIMVTAGGPRIPAALTAQLEDGGRLVAPVGSYIYQCLAVVTNRGGRFERQDGEGCVFVPLIGRDGWPDSL